MPDNVDKAFKNIRRESPQFAIWRVENFELVVIPKDQHGTFYAGDSYLILNLLRANDIKVHFWLGRETSQDEAGVAAIKAVELDEYLGGSPVQYREVQECESKVFQSYFKDGMKYMQGGVKSGFNKVVDGPPQPILFRVKGKKIPQFKQMPAVAWEHMNDGDVFILDAKKVIFVWIGKSASRTERRKAMEYARKTRDERGKGNLYTIEQGQEDMEPADVKDIFNQLLPINERKKLLPADKAGDDEAEERKASSVLKLWRCSEEAKTLKVTEISSGPLKRSMLDSGDSYIVDNGPAGIWVWNGKKASKEEKKQAMKNGQGFILKKGYPQNTKVTIVPEFAETVQFKSLFKQWDVEVIPGSIEPYSRNKIAKTVHTKFDAETLHQQPSIAAETRMVDDGSGEKKIWRIENFELKELEKKYVGKLFAGDCYIIHYTYMYNNKPKHILYYWLGKKSSQDEKGAAALLTVELDDSLDGAAVQVRVVQDKEPKHFMAMFQGKLIIYSGGKAGWGQTESVDGPGDVYLLQVRGTSPSICKAQQVPLAASSLNSNDCFVLFSRTAVYIWAGKGCTGDEREMAKSIASESPRGYNMVMEGQEKDDFWKLLGGKGEYASSPRLMIQDPEVVPRLFRCSNASGRFRAEEVLDFDQSDLLEEDVFILDAVDVIWIWIGKDARPEEKKMAKLTAVEYIATDPSGRDDDTTISEIKQGCEPPNFTGFFGSWDYEIWSKCKSYEQLKEEMKGKNIEPKNITVGSLSLEGEQDFSDIAKFSYEELTCAEPPEGVDKSNKEKHLTDAEFERIFKMKYQEFVSLVEWKQIRMKKEHNLF